jgi:putative flippase GtrA
MLRYSLVSLVSIAVSQSVLAVAFGMLHWTARISNIVACAVATVPSYYLNRSWAWGRRGRSHLWREVVPFWALAFAGLALSTWAAGFGSTLARQADVSHAATTAIVMGSSLLAFGVLWVGKFAIFNGLLFAERTPSAPALVVVVATAGLLLAGPAGIEAAQAQPGPPGSTGPPTTEPTTTAPPTTEAPTTAEPPTTEAPTTAPPTTAPVPTEPPTTEATTAPPSPTVVGGGEAATTTPAAAGGRSPGVVPGAGVPAGPGSPQGTGPSGPAGTGAATVPTTSSPGPGPDREPSSALSPPKVLRNLLEGGPGRVPQRVVEETAAACASSPRPSWACSSC